MTDEPITHEQHMARMLALAEGRARALHLMVQATQTLAGDPDEMSLENALYVAKNLVRVLSAALTEQEAELRRRSGLCPVENADT